MSDIIESKEFNFEIYAISNDKGVIFSPFYSKSIEPHLYDVQVDMFENERPFNKCLVNIQFCCDGENFRYSNIFSKVREILAKNGRDGLYVQNLYVKKKLPGKEILEDEESICLKVFFQSPFLDTIEEINLLY